MPYYRIGYEVRGVIHYWVEAPTPEQAFRIADNLSWGAADNYDFDIEGREVMRDGEPIPIDYDRLDDLEMEGE